MTARHVLAIFIAVVGTGAAGVVIVSAVRRLLDWRDRRTVAPTADEPFTGPLYPPAFEPEPEVIEGHVMAVDELGEWAPTEHPLLQPLIADALLVEQAWPTLHRPPSWSAWTGVHPVVRLADLDEFAAATA